MVDVMGGSKSLKQMHEEATYHQHIMLTVGKVVMTFFSRSAEAFLRVGFGQRYFNVLSAGSSMITLGVALYIACSNLQGVDQTLGNKILGGFLLAYVLLVLVHCWLIRGLIRLIWPDTLLHSRYSGFPLLMLPVILFREHCEKGASDEDKEVIGFLFGWINEHHIKLYVEPVVIWLIAVPVAKVSPQLSVWLAMAGISLAVGGQMLRFEAQQRYLDMIDARIESENLAHVIKGERLPVENQGVECWGAFNPKQQEMLLKD
jgi:hypothetical protein